MEAAQQPRGVERPDLNTACALATLSVPAGSRVLDLGCGDGTAARVLLAHQDAADREEAQRKGE